jgi:hypothetical protein
MSRLDDATVYDPYGWRVTELLGTTTGAQRRRALLDEMVVWEAEEIAHGRRHLTIVHGRPENVVESCRLDMLYDGLRELTRGAEWARVRGTSDYVTVTVSGSDADERIGTIEAMADAANRDSWRIVAAAVPPLGGL